MSACAIPDPARRTGPPAAPPRADRGFTLVELMVVLVVVAIISAIAMTSYRSYMLEARRATAVTALTDAASRQEQFFLNNRSYTVTLGAGGLNMDAATEGGAYTVSIDAATTGCPVARCWSMRAVPQGGQAEDDCGTLTYDSDGNRTPAGCW